MSVPSQLLGSWKLEKSEKFEEFLEQQGVNWMMRKMMKGMPMKKTLSANDDGSFSLLNDNPAKKEEIKFRLGEQLSLKHPLRDETMLVTFRVEGETLVADYEEDGKSNPQVYRLDGEMLLLERTSKGLSVKRWFKRL